MEHLSEAVLPERVVKDQKTSESISFALLKQKLGATRDDEVLSLALNILNWMIEESEKGKLVASLSEENKRFSIVTFEELEAIRTKKFKCEDPTSLKQ